MITALQDVSNVSVVNVAPVRDRALLAGGVRPLPATPSAIVMLGSAPQQLLTYNALGRLESQPAQPTSAFAATIADTAPTLSGMPDTASFALPSQTASALPAAAGAENAIPLAAGARTSTPTAQTVAPGPTSEERVTAAPLALAASAESRVVTSEPDATTERATSATAQAEAVLTALNASSANTVTAAPNVVGAPRTASTDGLAPTVTVAPADAVAAPAAGATAAATPAAPNVTGAAIPGVPNADAVRTQVPAPALGDTVMTPEDMLRNPFYPAMAASLYLSAMSFRLQQSSAAGLNNSADSVQMIGGVRAVAGVQSDRQGPADDFRNMTRTFA